jgi:glutathione synthase/RimK-type ligase-like ATP-grasp enzyme
VSTPRNWPPRRDIEQALRRVDRDLAAAVTDNALFARACLLDQLGHTNRARDAYIDVLARDPGHGKALANLGALLFAGGYTTAAQTTYAQAVAAHPDDPAAHVNLANLLRLAHQPAMARAHYETALRLAPDHPEAHQGMSYLLDGVDDAAAGHHRRRGFASRSLTTSTYRGTGTPLSILHLVSARGGNIPAARILDDRTCLVHTLVAEFADPAAPLPPHDLVFNAIGDADRCEEALAAAATLLTGTAAPVINPPQRIAATTRVRVAQLLSDVPGIIMPRTLSLPREALATALPRDMATPFLLRSPGFHTGQHFCRVDSLAHLPTALAALPGDPLLAIAYLDATGPDGASRKYRAMFIGGDILPLHLAISAHWKVHYFTADMATQSAHRAEEARFLADMPAVLGPMAMTALTAIRDRLALDYGGVDFALAPDGRLMVFEANATMTLVAPPADPMWDYRRQSYARVLTLSRDLIRRAVGREPEGSKKTFIDLVPGCGGRVPRSQ